MNRRVVRRLGIWLIAEMVILGCIPSVLTPSLPSEYYGTDIAKTIVVALTQTETYLQQQRTPTPTSTLTVTATPLVSPTPSLIPTEPVRFIFDPNVPGGVRILEDATKSAEETETSTDEKETDYTKTPVPKEWDCRVISKSPPIGTVLKGGTEFTAVWTVENTGTKTWPKQGVDVVRHSGAHLQTGKPYYDIPTSIGPGGTVTITISMAVAKFEKTYSTRWSLKVGKKEFCTVKFVVVVD